LSSIWTSNRGGSFEIYIADADGSGAKQITHDGRDAENATPTADSQWLVYVSSHPDKLGIWKIHPDGSGAARIAAVYFRTGAARPRQRGARSPASAVRSTPRPTPD
jgi:Tol biopolymer transport system component